jgi:hypothetical protein
MFFVIGVDDGLVELEDGDVVVGCVFVLGLEQLVDEDLGNVTLVIV